LARAIGLFNATCKFRHPVNSKLLYDRDETSQDWLCHWGLWHAKIVAVGRKMAPARIRDIYWSRAFFMYPSCLSGKRTAQTRRRRNMQNGLQDADWRKDVPLRGSRHNCFIFWGSFTPQNLLNLTPVREIPAKTKAINIFWMVGDRKKLTTEH
jgi:hypothetical protein